MGMMKGCHGRDFKVEETWLRPWVGSLNKENRANELTMSTVTLPESRRSSHCTVLTREE